MLSNIRIVLVRTFHPGNIGSALRAMKTMGLKELVLVSPQRFPDEEVVTMAAGAVDRVEGIQVVSFLEEAIADCSLVIGTSARKRGDSWPLLTASESGGKLVREASLGKVALVFGREKTGLTNEELQQCNFHVMISANPEYPVLNLAQAVQILCYEIWQAYQQVGCVESEECNVAHPDHKSVEVFYEALEQTLYDVNFIIRQHPGDIMIKLRRMFNRTRIESQELNILRGILARVQQNAAAKED